MNLALKDFGENYARGALECFQEVERLAPYMAPYFEMATLATRMGRNDLAVKYLGLLPKMQSVRPPLAAETQSDVVLRVKQELKASFSK
jgi:hypothetical protein